jgi:hypothetical protein
VGALPSSPEDPQGDDQRCHRQPHPRHNASLFPCVDDRRRTVVTTMQEELVGWVVGRRLPGVSVAGGSGRLCPATRIDRDRTWLCVLAEGHRGAHSSTVYLVGGEVDHDTPGVTWDEDTTSGRG